MKEERIRKTLDEAFDAVIQLVQRPEELEAMPDESVNAPAEMLPRKKK